MLGLLMLMHHYPIAVSCSVANVLAAAKEEKKTLIN